MSSASRAELFLSGSLAAPFDFTCVRTLHPFVHTIRLDEVADLARNRPPPALDVSDALREEILHRNFRPTPFCDQADEPMRL